METITFLLKKIISAIILPDGMIAICLLLAVFLMPARRLKSVVNTLIVSAFLLYFTLGNDYVAFWLVNNLEQKAVVLTKLSEKSKKNTTTVVVLSGGAYFENDHLLPTEDKLGDRTRARLLTAALLVRGQDIQEVFLSGGCSRTNNACDKPEAYYMAEFLENYLTKDVKITTEHLSRDTIENLENIQKLTADTPFFLITSAMHMPRAMTIATRLKLNAIPVLCDFQAHRTSTGIFDMILPSFHNLKRSRAAIHEYIGLSWFYIKFIFIR